MKKLPFLIASFLAILLFICCSSAQYKEGENRGYLVKVGDIAPDFEINMINGKSLKLSDLKGKVVMLQFTASWCGVCRKEMPFIESEIWQVHKNKDFMVIGIDRDEPLDKVKMFVEKTGITYPMALDPNADIFALHADIEAGVTRNAIINKEGKIVYLTRLFNREEFDNMKTEIEKLLSN